MTRRARAPRLLPGVLVAGRRRARARSTRDWVVDIADASCVAAVRRPRRSCADDARPRRLRRAGSIASTCWSAPVACGALWWRRRWPVALVASLRRGRRRLARRRRSPAVIALFTVAVHRPFRCVAPLLAALVARRPRRSTCDLTRTRRAALRSTRAGGRDLGVVVLPGACSCARGGSWSRRCASGPSGPRPSSSCASSRPGALERARIAREMHDVLAHRISLLSLHAGALEFRPDAPPERGRARGGRDPRPARTRRWRTCAR